MVLDEGKSVTNLKVASLPASVGLLLIAYPWLGNLDPSLIGPIMVPFGFVWLVAAFCISSYHSELILDRDKKEVAYRSSLLLHSWANRVTQDNVERVILEKDNSRYRFILKVEKGEDLLVTTVDYWRSREWSEHVATFLDVPLEDRCRELGEVSPDQLHRSIQDDEEEIGFPEELPDNVAFQWHNAGRATIKLPKRGLASSRRPRILLGTVAVIGGLAGFFLVPGARWWLLVGGVLVSGWAWTRPLARATHHEEIEVSPNGLVAIVSMLGRSRRTSISAHEIREISIVEGEDVRFEHTDFDRHAVILEGPDGHIQLGANLPQASEVEWLRQVLLFILTQPRARILAASDQGKNAPA